MAYLGRLYDFTPGQLIQSTQVDLEFAQLVDTLNGAKTNAQVRLIHAAGTVGLEVDNTGGGIIQTWKKNGAAVAHVNIDGQFESDLATGTAPIKVDSTTMVANLNADTVDGVEATSLLRTDVDSQIIASGAVQRLAINSTTASILELNETVTADGEFRIITQGGVTLLEWYDDTLVQWLTFLRLDHTTDTVKYKNSELVSLSDVDLATIPWSFGVFYAGGIDVSVKQAIWVVPNDEDSMIIDRIRWVFQSGSPTGTSQIKLQHKNSAGAELNTWTASLLVGDSSLTTYELDVGNVGTTQGDFFEWTVMADGGHQDISIHVQGTQTPNIA